jgi:hypothetical protein
MSRENVELARGILEDFIAGKSDLDAAGTLTKLAGEEYWDPDKPGRRGHQARAP